jgi:2,4-dienoyl-CoA reductase-like NADH-dependent reductase (Old Yellow Enzyme family)
MSNVDLGAPLTLTRGPAWKNRLALAPLTNQQSHADGTLSDAELRWLVMRADGGFGLTMTCAAHVQPSGQGFPGQLGAFGDQHLPGLARLAEAIRAAGSIGAVQLHHAGIRADRNLVGVPVGPSNDAETGARALTGEEVERLRDDFIAAALRADAAGFEGVEVHGAHGYVLTQFLSSETNRRHDDYGGSLENRARLLLEILEGIRGKCRGAFQLGLRLSPERFGLELGEMRELAGELLGRTTIDYLDLSLWNAFKEPMDRAFSGTLLSQFTTLNRGGVRIGAAGAINGAGAAGKAIEEGCDFVLLGRAAILQHDAATRILADPAAVAPPLPVTADYLANQGLSPPFIDYVRTFPNFVA